MWEALGVKFPPLLRWIRLPYTGAKALNLVSQEKPWDEAQIHFSKLQAQIPRSPAAGQLHSCTSGAGHGMGLKRGEWGLWLLFTFLPGT